MRFQHDKLYIECCTRAPTSTAGSCGGKAAVNLYGGKNIESIQISTQPPPYQWKLVQRDENPPSEQDGSGGRGSPAYRHFALVSGAEHVQRRYLKLGLSLPNNNGIPAWLVVDGNAIACRVYDIRSTGVSPQQPWPAMRLRATGPAPPPPPIMVLPLPDGLEVAKYIMAESGSWGVRRVPVFLDVNREGAPGSGGRFTFKITFAVDGGIEIGPLALKRDAGGCMVLMEINSITESSFEKAAEECGQKLNPREMRLCGENNKPVLYFGDDRIELRKDYMP
ncbi:hypothetical protein FOL47_001422 [Perkinsus chesapeaki]|uniref:Uncharacterized protein n=1 Tax=Perkinsus chesapeaki TaxID=330153 RepID=A0A7J6MJK6_PERCH|nr:hypothetical protein FOL47_001422 [Perkinsus chesapeaki]